MLQDCRESALPRTGFKPYDLGGEVRLAPLRDGPDAPPAKKPRVALPDPAAGAAEQDEDPAAYALLANYGVPRGVQNELAAESAKRAEAAQRRVGAVAEQFGLEGGPAVVDEEDEYADEFAEPGDAVAVAESSPGPAHEVPALPAQQNLTDGAESD